MTRRAKTLWTIGYEGHSPESLVLALRKARVARVLDIRELPLSRRAGFSKTALAAGLAHAGIAYTHLRALGTPRVVRHAYKAGGDFARFRTDYLAHVDAQPEALDEVERLARSERCALLCVEHEHGTCHRGVLAERLEARGWMVTHL